MTTYLYYYQALSAAGRRKRGFLFSSDLRQLKYITSIKGTRLQSGKRLSPWLASFLLFFLRVRKTYRISSRSQNIFFRGILNLLNSGLSVQKMCEALIQQEKNQYFLRALVTLYGSLVLGQAMSTSIKEAFSFLPDEYTLLLSGCSDTESVIQIFSSLVDASEEASGLGSAIMRMGITFSGLLVITVFVFRFYTKVYLMEDRIHLMIAREHISFAYESFFQIFSGEALFNWRYLLGVILLIASVVIVRKNERLFLLWRKAIFRIPIIGEQMRMRLVTSLFFFLYLQIKSGKTLQKGLRNVLFLMRKTPCFRELYHLSQSLEQGLSFEDVIDEVTLFSSDERSLLRSSILGGSLEDALVVLRQFLGEKLSINTLIFKELIRFSLISFLLGLYGWALYTYMYQTIKHLF